jgi:hypothetical protein
VGGPNKSNYLGGVLLLMIWLDSKLPDKNEFDPQSFVALCSHMQQIRFILPRNPEDQLKADNNWSGFLKSIDTPGSPEAWRKLKNNSVRADQRPKNAKRIDEFVCMSVGDMYRKIMRETFENASAIKTVEQYKEVLEGYTSKNTWVDIYDRYLFKFQIQTLRKNSKKAPGDMKRSFRLLLQSLSSHGYAPEKIRIISRCSQWREYTTQKKKTWPEYEKWVDSDEYYRSTKDLLADLINWLQKEMPEYKTTSFVIYDCSNLEQHLMHHDRFINIMNNVLISSSGYNLDPGKKFDSDKEIPGRTTLGPTYIIPVKPPSNLNPENIKAIIFEDF